MTINAITGLPGAGKTLMMMKKIFKEVRQKKMADRIFFRDKEEYRLIIITNFPVNRDYFEYPGIDIIEISNDDINYLYRWILEKKYFGASIYLDEAGILFPSMDYKNIPKNVILALRQHRHAGYDLYYTAQDLDDVSAGLRRVTQFETRVSGWNALRFSSYCTYGVRKGKANLKDKYDRGIFIHTKKLYNSYSTHHNIGTPSYLDIHV